METETKNCKICGIEKPKTAFALNRYGTHNDVCRDCVKAKYRQTRAANKPTIGGGVISTTPTSTAKTPSRLSR